MFSDDDSDKTSFEYGQLDELPAGSGPSPAAAAALGSVPAESSRRQRRSLGRRALDWLRSPTYGRGRTCCNRCPSLSTRYQISLMSAIGFCISFGIRCNMGLAVLQMTSNQTRWTMTPIVQSIHPNLTVEMVRQSVS